VEIAVISITAIDADLDRNLRLISQTGISTNDDRRAFM
jgi:hypothetical protein